MEKVCSFINFHTYIAGETNTGSKRH